MGQMWDSITGKTQSDAAKSADKAYAKQGEIIKKIVALFDTKMGAVEGAKASGLWNPDKQIEMSNAEMNRNRELTKSADAGTARTLGYRPGDTAPIQQQQQTNQDFDLKMRLQNFGIRQQSMQGLLNAYNQINPSELQGAMSGLGQQGQMYTQQSQAPNPLWNAAAMYASGGGFGGGGGGGGGGFSQAISGASQGGASAYRKANGAL